MNRLGCHCTSFNYKGAWRVDNVVKMSQDMAWGGL